MPKKWITVTQEPGKKKEKKKKREVFDSAIEWFICIFLGLVISATQLRDPEGQNLCWKD